MLEPGKVKCIFMGYRGIEDYQLRRLNDVTSKAVLYGSTGFNESDE